jgi:hypothetical protein
MKLGRDILILEESLDIPRVVIEEFARDPLLNNLAASVYPTTSSR